MWLSLTLIVSYRMHVNVIITSQVMCSDIQYRARPDIIKDVMNDSCQKYHGTKVGRMKQKKVASGT